MSPLSETLYAIIPRLYACVYMCAYIYQCTCINVCLKMYESITYAPDLDFHWNVSKNLGIHKLDWWMQVWSCHSFYMMLPWLESETVKKDTSFLKCNLSKHYIQQNTIILAGTETTVCRQATSCKENAFRSCSSLLYWNLPTKIIVL